MQNNTWQELEIQTLAWSQIWLLLTGLADKPQQQGRNYPPSPQLAIQAGKPIPQPPLRCDPRDTQHAQRELAVTTTSLAPRTTSSPKRSIQAPEAVVRHLPPSPHDIQHLLSL